MSPMIGKVLVAALVAGAVQALPYGPASSNTTTASWTTVSGTAASSSSVVTSQPPTSTLSPAQSSAAAAAAASAAAANKALASKLLTDPTQVDRFNDLLTVDGAGKELLSDDAVRERVVFDFNKAPAAGEGGRILLATEDNFPILTEFGLATAVAFLVHPRATEFLTLVQGELQTGFVLENGFLVADKDTATVTQISANLTAFQSTIFPQGSIHFQLNPTCEPATFVSTLNSADPGTSQIAQNFFSLDAGIVNTALGGFPEQISADNIGDFRQHIPNNLALEIEQCAMRCGLSH
ncbi:hypothetical protein M8818_004536 [Zalaria obscura]|uniref:Uncharacterized protein n=1 Tax=Zalaria obscura TaxID=2024903 RepID=A0ACC3SCB5_9PEZI